MSECIKLIDSSTDCVHTIARQMSVGGCSYSVGRRVFSLVDVFLPTILLCTVFCNKVTPLHLTIDLGVRAKAAEA